MPHKVNPINFENAEGNVCLSNALFEAFSRKLPVSRMQRDLTDSTVTRNFGVAFGHLQLALSSVAKGLETIEVDREVLLKDLMAHPEVVSEGVQTLLKVAGDDAGYEKVRAICLNHEYDKLAVYLTPDKFLPQYPNVFRT